MLRKRLATLHRRTFAILIVALFFCSNAQAADYPEEALTGLDGIKVLVAGLDEDAQKAGITRQHLENAVTRRLKKAGIPVRDRFDAQPGNPFLYIQLDLLKVSDSPLFAYTIEVSLIQDAWINRGPGQSNDILTPITSATTGSSSTLGYAGQDVFVNTVTRTVERFADDFAFAYLAKRLSEREAAWTALNKNKAEQPTTGDETRPATPQKPFDPAEYGASNQPVAPPPEQSSTGAAKK